MLTIALATNCSESRRSAFAQMSRATFPTCVHVMCLIDFLECRGADEAASAPCCKRGSVVLLGDGFVAAPPRRGRSSRHTGPMTRRACSPASGLVFQTRDDNQPRLGQLRTCWHPYLSLARRKECEASTEVFVPALAAVFTRRLR